MPDLWFYGILNFLKKGRASFNFCKIRVMVLKLHTNILHPSGNFGIEFGQNRLKHSNFFRFWIFWEFFQNCLTQANFDLSSWNWHWVMFDTKFCKNRRRLLNFRQVWIFFYRDIKFKKFDVSTKLPPWGSQHQVTYFLKKRTFWNRWGSNMGISIYILFKYFLKILIYLI